MIMYIDLKDSTRIYTQQKMEFYVAVWKDEMMQFAATWKEQ